MVVGVAVAVGVAAAGVERRQVLVPHRSASLVHWLAVWPSLGSR
jgi:hypothetical protein